MAESNPNDPKYQAAIRRWNSAAEFDSEDRAAALDDMRFLGGRQWSDSETRERKSADRKTVTINQLPKFVRQITNEGRMNEVALNVLPEDDKADEALAKVLKGLIRGIEYESEAESVYDECLDNAAACGRGAMRLVTEYVDDMSFDQCIRIRSIEDPFAVFWDRNAKMYDKSDAEYVFVSEWVDNEEFKEKYGRDPVTASTQTYMGENWSRDKETRIAEYYYKEKKFQTIWLLMDGTVVDPSEDPRDKETFEAEGKAVIRDRKVERTKVFRRLMDGEGFVDEPEEIASKYLPVIPVMGKKHKVDGQVQYWSGIRWSKSPQYNYNLWTSLMSEKAALAPRTPWLVTPSMVKGRENEWRDMNIKNFAYAVYEPDSKAPTLKPERQEPSYVQQAELGLLMQADQDLKSTSGFYGENLGEEQANLSGVAIQRRQSPGEIQTYEWVDNLHKSIRHMGRVILDMIPRVYDTQRVVRIVDEKDALEWVTLNQYVADGPQGKQINNDITIGKYSVKIDTGPSYKTAREEASSNLTALMGALPEQMSAGIADLAVENMDFKGATEAAQRLGVMNQFRKPTEEQKEEMPEPPGMDPMVQMELQKLMLDMEGKQLTNMQRRFDLAEDAGQRQQLLKTVQSVNELLMRDVGPQGPPQGGMM